MEVCTHFTDYAKPYNGKIFIKSHLHGKRPLADTLIYVDAPQGHYFENEVGWTEIRLFFVCKRKYHNIKVLSRTAVNMCNINRLLLTEKPSIRGERAVITGSKDGLYRS